MDFDERKEWKSRSRENGTAEQRKRERERNTE